MPIPMISAEIYAKSKTCENGWSLLELDAVRFNPSNNGKSVNTFFDFTAVSGPNNSDDNAGRKISYMVAGGAIEAGVADAVNVYIQFICAMTDLSPQEVIGAEVDENKLIGRKVWAEIGDKPVEGKLYKDFKCFSPAGTIPF